MADRYRHCPYCGASYGELAWPRSCSACKGMVYRNPLPVVVVLLPITDAAGLLLVRRAIEPGRGKLALPGGYIDWNDPSWQDAGTRELREETGIVVRAEGLTEFRVMSTQDGRLLVFAVAEGIASGDVPTLESNNEVGELVIVRQPTELAFPTHTMVVEQYFRERSG